MTSDANSAQDAGGVVGPDVVAACALSSVPGIGATSLARIARAFGTLAAAMKAGPKKIVKLQAELQLKPEALAYLEREPDLEDLGLWAVDAARAAGARVVLLGDPWYPALLRQIEHPPPLLYVRGSIQTDVPRIAVVGSRDSDDYGVELARDLAEGLALSGVQVVSGGARGVDAAAHAGALWGQGTTLAVLGCGIDLVYPPENAALFERLASGGGAVVSEFPPGTQPRKENFPRRNRTISGLSSAVIVVRAAQQSGALLTANHAAAQGRQIFAVPGAAGDPLSAGPNQLLTLGAARAVTGAAGVLQALGWKVSKRLQERDAERADEAGRARRRGAVFPDPTVETPRAPALEPPASSQPLDELALRIWRLLDERTPLHVDELAARAHVAAHEALRKLSELEVRGLCLQRPGKYFLKR